MKTTKLFIATAIFLLATTSCVEKSNKYQAVLAERDSLRANEQLLMDEFNITLDIINEIDAKIKEAGNLEDNLVMNIEDVEANPRDKDQISAKVYELMLILDSNNQRITELEEKLERSGKENSALAKTIKRLRAELTQKQEAIAQLQEDLSKKNIKINELNDTIKGLYGNIAMLEQVDQIQKNVIEEQEKEINKVWYIVATGKELKKYNIVSDGGLFKSDRVLEGNYDPTAFTESDMRQLSSIKTDYKKIKILSNHPKDSYVIIVDGDNKSTLEITDGDKFWSITKMLIIKG